MMRRSVCVFVVLAVAVAAVPMVVRGGGVAPLVGGVWQWERTLLSDDTVIAANDPRRYTIEFRADGTLALKLDCNSGGGAYTATDGRMTLTLGPSTLVGCPPDSQADIFTRQLMGVNEYVFTGDALILNIRLDTGGMRFTRLVNTALTDTEWEGRAFNNGRGGVTTPLPGTQFGIRFTADGRVSGASGCNTFTGAYTAGGDTLTFGPLATTRRACVPEVNAQEGEILAALAATRTYRITGTALTFSDAAGARTAEFAAR